MNICFFNLFGSKHGDEIFLSHSWQRDVTLHDFMAPREWIFLISLQALWLFGSRPVPTGRHNIAELARRTYSNWVFNCQGLWRWKPSRGSHSKLVVDNQGSGKDPPFQND